MAMKGIDVSKHNGKVDWKKVKADGVQFAILRAGYGKLTSQKDPTFEANYAGAKAAGIPVGAYWYSYAVTTAETKQEAEACLSVLKGKQFEYPIFFDLEEKKAFQTGKANCTAMVQTFCDTLEKSKYYAGLYMSRSPFCSYTTDAVRTKYALWLAEYNTRLNYNGAVGIWQRSSTGKVNGISGNVDINEGYQDYRAIIQAKGYNGYAASKPSATSGSAKKSVDVIAHEVLDGKWGNGNERKKKLASAGYDYNAVQQRVNALCRKKSVDEIAREVLNGKWGNGEERRKKLTAAGYDYDAVQKKVNALCR